MPYVNVRVTRGATREQEPRLVEDDTGSPVRVLGMRPSGRVS